METWCLARCAEQDALDKVKAEALKEAGAHSRWTMAVCDGTATQNEQ